MKVSELMRLLVKAGCYLYRRGSRHDMWMNPKTGKTFAVPRHKTEELKPGTLAAIKEKAGI